ncbi:hypothetical protein PoB_004405800 [Plakobranchus ocellatus]|uniref:Uncharacterized protein n=1 Tax=Plakobranchus ocellatus TaxID=259542 RepID=A0AAV4BEF2_9GAST|nr:hypothetical protein PoB_004405800 [Plakobranchus ocellatus]
MDNKLHIWAFVCTFMSEISPVVNFTNYRSISTPTKILNISKCQLAPTPIGSRSPLESSFPLSSVNRPPVEAPSRALRRPVVKYAMVPSYDVNTSEFALCLTSRAPCVT